MNASGSGFQSYAGGVYNGDVECDDNPTELDHAITAVGFGMTDDQPTMTVKNSWGTGWGDAGFFYVSRDGTSNTCGIYTFANYPLGVEMQEPEE